MHVFYIHFSGIKRAYMYTESEVNFMSAKFGTVIILKNQSKDYYYILDMIQKTVRKCERATLPSENGDVDCYL